MSRTQKLIGYGSGVVFVLIFATIGIHLLLASHAATTSNAPTSPPVEVCNNASLLNGPSAAPAGAVSIPAGNNSSLFPSQLPANTTYYFASGTHTVGAGQFSQIQPGNGDTFIGAPGAIVDGQDDNNFAFVGGTNVTIEYLTIQNFTPPGNQGAINTNSGSGWQIEHDTIQDNLPGGAMMLGSNNTVTNNCLTHNGQYAFNAYLPQNGSTTSALTQGPQNITVTNNEISYNDTCNWEAVSNFPITSPSRCAGASQMNDCGCSGGGKFWATDGATFNDNYVHDNYNVGMWADTNNVGFDVEGNYFANNYAEAIIYEISYNADIKDNTFINNANGFGPTLTGFPGSTIYISESGGDSRVPGFSSGSLDITGNVFTNNWGGVALWENANRYCSSDANTSGGYCTLANTSGSTAATLASCNSRTNLMTTPYINDCRWKTQNVTVSDNTFNFTPSAIGSDCTESNGCGLNGIFSEFGTDQGGTWPTKASGCVPSTQIDSYPYYSWIVPNDISNNQNNLFKDNVYNGPWNFDGFAQGNYVNWSQWSGGFNTNDAVWPCGGSSYSFNAQDVGSTYNSQAAPTPPPKPSTPGNVNAKVITSPLSVTVGWSASGESGGQVTGYHIFRDGTEVGSSTTTTYTDTSVVAGTTYSYTVEAYDNANPPNISDLSSAVSVTTPSSSTTPPVNPPSVPGHVAAHANSANSVTVTWMQSTDSGGPGLKGYYVLQNGVNITPLGVEPTSSQAMSYTDSSVMANTTYNYTIEAYDKAVPANVSAQSMVASVKTPSPPDTTPPSTPTGLTAAAVSDSQINLSWNHSTDNVGVNGYYLYRSTGTGSTATRIATVNPTNTVAAITYGDTGLTASTTYYYYVIAYDGAGNQSASSGIANATTKAPNNGYTAVQGIVTDSKTGERLAGVCVNTGPIATHSGAEYTLTNSSGQYYLANLIHNRPHSYYFTLKGYTRVHLALTLPVGIATEDVKLAANPNANFKAKCNTNG